MKTENFLKENHPKAKKKLRLPDQLELVMEEVQDKFDKVVFVEDGLALGSDRKSTRLNSSHRT